MPWLEKGWAHERTWMTGRTITADTPIDIDALLGNDDWDEAPRRRADDEILTINVESWEGPLDLLLALARTQKVDLREISILALVEQYLAFIEQARELKLELAADYLVMAAWLAYLKSGLLLPREAQPDPSPEELALRLHLRLQRLEAMREAGARLLARDRIGRDVFPRGAPEGLHRPRAVQWQASLFELIQAYGQVKARNAPRVHIVARRPVMTLDAAIERVSQLLGLRLDWSDIQSFLPETADPRLKRSALASSFLAALELARQGRVELRQEGVFAPLYLRRLQGGRP
jgi:segregation and condensation protein A